MKSILVAFTLFVCLPLNSFAEKFSAFCLKIWRGKSFEQVQVPCSIEMEIGRLTISFPKRITFITENLDSKKNGVTTYTVRDPQGCKYRVHLSLNPFEEGTMLLNISDYKTDNPILGYVIIYK